MLLYGCEIWQTSSSVKHKVDGTWNNCFSKIFNACWRECAKPLLFFCNTMPVSLLVDQKKFFFIQKQPPVANYILITYRNWHALIRYPVPMIATPTLKWPFGAISPRHLLCNFYLKIPPVYVFSTYTIYCIGTIRNF